MLIDTHTHLFFSDFEGDLDDVVRRAVAAGVEKMIVPGTDLATSRRAIEMAEQYEPVYAAVGVHPQETKTFSPSQLDQFRKMTGHTKVVAVGEIGLDYYRDYAPHELQKEVLISFLNLAGESGLPVIVHNRQAFQDVFALICREEYREIAGVFHCFSGDVPEARRIIEQGYLISFTGTITFKKSRAAAVARQIALEHQLVETDAPFMAPVPYRGKRNEPAFVRFVAEKQAELHGIDFAQAAKITTENAFRLFAKLSN